MKVVRNANARMQLAQSFLHFPYVWLCAAWINSF